MLYWLLYQKLFPYFRPFRIFRYLTFRTAFASLTAMLIALLIGPFVIEKLREFQIGQYIREDGPKDHQKKAGTPTMGGVLICIAILLAYVAVERPVQSLRLVGDVFHHGLRRPSALPMTTSRSSNGEISASPPRKRLGLQIISGVAIALVLLAMRSVEQSTPLT